MLSAIERIENVANGRKVKRLLFRPFNYVKGLLHSKFIYPKYKNPLKVTAMTLMGLKMNLHLPAGLDIYLTGGKTHDSEIRLTKWMIQNLNPNDNVIDVGGHFGFYSLLAYALKCNVIGVEASPATYEIYHSNVKSYEKINPLNLAISSQAGEVTFYEFPTLYSEYNTTNPEQFKNAKWISKNPPQKINVKSQSLDEVAETHKVKPDFIKIDVEGAEAEVISGMTHLLNHYRPIIALEYLVSSRQNDSHILASSKLEDAGYQSYCINADGSLSLITDKEASIKARNLDSDNILFLPH